ncbi:spore germination protein GerW family protein [Lysinibacter sp. HNR]|uniref:spore germination protein GerW family protein n=1 Tax=Lysinibacter sp. HNR TaxID=3031408 RepID=UPI0024353116|nr:spore germination protein GerW family protein [Lysinibacter sp. HNR]WGD38445.1 spore germination protein GerW family protein [Lysinibacter sp. HNR]
MENITVELAKIVTKTGVKAAYGEPIVLDDTTVIPVACSWFGFGAGEGKEKSREDAISGGGGGGAAVPVGSYVKRGDSLTFQVNPVTALVAAIPLVCVAGRALTRLIRALKK